MLTEIVQRSNLNENDPDHIPLQKAKSLENELRSGTAQRTQQALVYDVSEGLMSHAEGKEELDRKVQAWRDDPKSLEGISPDHAKQAIYGWQQESRNKLHQNYIGGNISPDNYVNELFKRSQLSLDHPEYVNSEYAYAKIQQLTKKVKTDMYAELTRQTLSGHSTTDKTVQENIRLRDSRHRCDHGRWQ